MGKEEFSRAISMEGVQRTINAQLQERLKLLATGQPIPEETEAEETEEAAEEEASEEAVAEAVDEAEEVVEAEDSEEIEE